MVHFLVTQPHHYSGIGGNGGGCTIFTKTSWYKMIFGPDGENIVGKDICTSYTALPGRRMSTQSLICEASSIYPSSVPMRQGSLCHLDKIAYEARIAQLNEFRDIRLPPPSCVPGPSRRRRSSVASSQAALAGSGFAYAGGSSGSRCHSSMGHYGLEPELWVTRRMSLTHSELLNEVNLSPSRQRWSEAGRSFGETTVRASARQFRSGADFLVPGSRQPSSRRMTSEEPSMSEDLMDMSFTDSLMQDSNPSYEKVTRKDKKRRNSKAGYHCYDNPSSLKEYNGQ